MLQASKEDLNQDLEMFEKKILLIALSDPEQYNIFSLRLKETRDTLLGISDIELERNKAKIIANIATMLADFDAYMDGKNYEPIDAFLPGKELESGRSKLRKYKMGVYTNALDEIKKREKIFPKDIRDLKTKWIDESDDVEFSPFEASAMEERFADAFLEYQIKYAKETGTLSKEPIAEYTTAEEYQDALKKRLVSLAKEKELSPDAQIELSSLIDETELDVLLTSRKMWSLLASRQVSLTTKEAQDALKPKEIAKRTEEDKDREEKSSLPMIVPPKDMKKAYMICTLEKKNRLFNRGQVKYKQVKVRIRDGNAKLPERYKDSIVEAYISGGVTNIAKEGFMGCPKLKKVTLPDSLETVGMSAFRDCPALEETNMPASVKTIATYAFLNCKSLKDIDFCEGLQYIAQQAFCGCGSLKCVKLPKTVHTLREGAFMNCSNLEEIYFSDIIHYLPDQCLSNCRKLKTIKFPFNLSKIGNHALENCKGLTDLSNLPNSLRYIGDYAMWGCDNIEKINFPEFLEGAGKKPFLHSKNIKEVIMGRKIKDGNALFKLGISKDADIVVPEEAEGGFYEDFKLQPDTRTKFSDIISKLAYVEGKRREDYLKEYYGPDAKKFIGNEKE